MAEPITDDPALDRTRMLVQAELGDHVIEDYQWKGLVKRRYPFPDREVIDQDEALREAVMDTAAAWKDLYGTVPPSVGRPKTRPPQGIAISNLAGLRQDALSALYAADARTDEGLIEFRRTVLGGQLLPGGDQVDQACREWIYGFEQGWMHFGTLMSARLVADEPDDERRYDMPDPLRALHELTEQLGKRYDWIKGATTQFVLTDREPRVYPLRAHGRIPYSWISASRITMVIDPATSPEEVAELYQRIRKSNSYYAGAQVRPLTEKALLLAAFSAGTHDGERAADQVKRWNALHPEHAYDHSTPTAVSNFRRDLKQARDRLLHPRLGAESGRDAQQTLHQNRTAADENPPS